MAELRRRRELQLPWPRFHTGNGISCRGASWPRRRGSDPRLQLKVPCTGLEAALDLSGSQVFTCFFRAAVFQRDFGINGTSPLSVLPEFTEQCVFAVKIGASGQVSLPVTLVLAGTAELW